MFGGAFSRGKVISAVDQAATELIELHPDGPTDRMLALATRIIANAHISTGPSTSTAYKAEEMAERWARPALRSPGGAMAGGAQGCLPGVHHERRRRRRGRLTELDLLVLLHTLCM